MRSRSPYDAVADLYDTYVQVAFDLAFFQREARKVSGSILELMAGTGRVSRSIAEVNPHLTCVDASRAMLRRLKALFSDVARRPQIVCADVRALPLEAGYDLAVLPFNSFMELTSHQNQLAALLEIKRCLRPEAHFICTLHNPIARVASLSDDERLLGSWPLAGERGRLEVWIRERLDPDRRTAVATQTYRVYDSQGREMDARVLTLRYALISQHVFEALVRESGFESVALFGDYDGSSFVPGSSPYMIWTLRKPRLPRVSQVGGAHSALSRR